MRAAKSSLQVIRNARARTRTSVALLLVLLLAGGINFLFVRDFSLITDDALQQATEHHLIRQPTDVSTRRHRPAPRSTDAEVENRTEWMTTIARGVTLDMYNLTQLNDCKRLPSWRANEKRFIRLQADRQKSRNCIRTASLNHTQLFGLRAVADMTPVSHQYYMEYEHEGDDVPPETPLLYREVARYLKQQGVDPETSEEGKKEAERLFSLASVVTSDAFLWEDSSDHRHNDAYSVEDMVTSGRMRKSTAPRYAGRLELNPEALQECSFSRVKALSHPDLDSFSEQGYRLVEFMFQETFLRHGWITVPTAGTALGTLRHHGMFRGDDDMDMMTYPPAKYLLGDAAWGDIYDDFDVLVESFGEEHPSWFSWFRSNDYRTHRPWFTKNDKKKRLPGYPFREYEDHIRHDGRVCFSQYMTFNASEKRRLFMTEGCTPNHWFMCLQPSSYIYARHDELFERHIIQDVQGIFTEDKSLLQKHLSEIGPMIFTAFHRRPAGKFCKCKFGFVHNSTTTPSYSICFDNLPDFVQYWYDGKWCVPSGAVRTRKWSFLKSWND